MRVLFIIFLLSFLSGCYKKCGEDYVGLDNKFLLRNMKIKHFANGIFVRDIVKNFKDDIAINSRGNIILYLKNNGFICSNNNGGVRCVLREYVKIIPASSCDKGSDVMYSKGVFVVSVFVKNDADFDVEYDFLTSK